MSALAAMETEVSSKAKRRQYTAEFKRRILREADACTKPGELGALLRREGLYSSHLVTWRAQRDRGELAGLAPKKRGPKPRPVDERDREIALLKREKARLEARLEKAEAIIEVQKKVSQLLGVELPPDPRSTEKR
jgi:transposase-like protein